MLHLNHLNELDNLQEYQNQQNSELTESLWSLFNTTTVTLIQYPSTMVNRAPVHIWQIRCPAIVSYHSNINRISFNLKSCVSESYCATSWFFSYQLSHIHLHLNRTSFLIHLSYHRPLIIGSLLDISIICSAWCFPSSLLRPFVFYSCNRSICSFSDIVFWFSYKYLYLPSSAIRWSVMTYTYILIIVFIVTVHTPHFTFTFRCSHDSHRLYRLHHFRSLLY